MYSTYLLSIVHYNTCNTAQLLAFHSLLQSELRFHYMIIDVILLVTE